MMTYTNHSDSLIFFFFADFIIEEDDVLLTFLKDRELNGDLIAKVSDKLWMRKAINIDNIEADLGDDVNQPDEVIIIPKLLILYFHNLYYYSYFLRVRFDVFSNGYRYWRWQNGWVVLL